MAPDLSKVAVVFAMVWKAVISLALLFWAVQGALVVLKLAGGLDWSWSRVATPLWGALALTIVALVLGLMLPALRRNSGSTPPDRRK